MRNDKDSVTPFHKHLMSFGAFILALAVIITPRTRISIFGWSCSSTGLMVIAGIALLVFGMVFGLLAAISARRAHVLRMKEQASQAQADVVDSVSRTEVNLDKPMAAAVPASASAAIFSVPEPRVMTVDSAARPRVEPSLSAKA